MVEFPVLTTKRCRLRRLTCLDIPVLQEIFNDSLTKNFLPELQALVQGNAGVELLLSTFDAYLDMGEGVLWGINDSDRLVGFIAVLDLSCTPTIIYAAHPSFRSRGYLKESIQAVLQYMREVRRCSCLHSEVYKENVVSIHLLESNGFTIYSEDQTKIYLRYEMSSLQR